MTVHDLVTLWRLHHAGLEHSVGFGNRMGMGSQRRNRMDALFEVVGIALIESQTPIRAHTSGSSAAHAHDASQ